MDSNLCGFQNKFSFNFVNGLEHQKSNLKLLQQEAPSNLPLSIVNYLFAYFICLILFKIINEKSIGTQIGFSISFFSVFFFLNHSCHS